MESHLFPERSAALAESLSAAVGPAWHVEVWSELTSTMDRARELLPVNTVEMPVLVLADAQSAGRGRQGREWQSTEGAFLGTFVFRCSHEVSALGGFSLLVGLAVREALECALLLKWPNDLVDCEGRKVGGILVELVSSGGDLGVLVGVGLNVRHAPQFVPHATALSDLGCRFLSPDEIAKVLSRRLFLAFQEVLRRGFEPSLSSWLSAAYGRGYTWIVDLGDQAGGGAPLEGRMVGISPTGALLIEDPRGAVRHVTAGHVLAIRAPGAV